MSPSDHPCCTPTSAVCYEIGPEARTELLAADAGTRVRGGRRNTVLTLLPRLANAFGAPTSLAPPATHNLVAARAAPLIVATPIESINWGNLIAKFP